MGQYYSANRFLTEEEMKVNARFIFDYLRPLGWTANSICGMLGNMQTESSINPGIWESLDEGNLDGGFGLVQWTPASKYLDWCTSHDLIPYAMESNLQRILFEVANGLQWSDPEMSFTEFTHSTDTAYSLAMKFITAYERPYNPNQPVRGSQAEYWFSTLTEIAHSQKISAKVYLLINKKRRII
jgi:hypothetical protein